MLSLFYEWGNRAAWIAAAIIAVLFFYAIQERESRRTSG